MCQQRVWAPLAASYASAAAEPALTYFSRHDRRVTRHFTVSAGVGGGRTRTSEVHADGGLEVQVVMEGIAVAQNFQAHCTRSTILCHWYPLYHRATVVGVSSE
jgi:hypothetical protein